MKEIIQLFEDEKVYAIVYLSDNSLLYIRERYQKSVLIKYSYHYVSHEGVHRWDNVPHHMSVSSFPYHYHDHDTIKESEPMDIMRVIEEIEKIRFQ